jgi:protein-ribulosamine 3-kinase
MIPEEVKCWLLEQGFGEVTTNRGVGGGCISNGAILITSTEASFFLKTNPSAPHDMFEREAEGLASLNKDDAPLVPAAFLVGKNFLLLENLSPAPVKPNYWELFGRQLAVLHKYTGSQFGFEHDNYIGSTPQPNGWLESGYDFFAERRLNFQARLAHQRGLFSKQVLVQVERLSARLKDFVPVQPASLIHGDLWSGNVISDAQGNPVIIDPAAHYGWAEAELAMTTLFGSFPESFYRAYQEINPLVPGYRKRFYLYNLYHLINHLNLFGRSYLDQVQGVLRQYI